ncbi:Methyltransferase-like protein 25 [Sciurus carolinensis]|uniref:Methyltransferase-like protein 25 n=1 Tax=Sciurus carolinensis TaxID=30640 RepID=A0AA41NJ30_SCICA|nr:Methyltransferase-like protein 25 [Sciurus carolinensis]
MSTKGWAADLNRFREAFIPSQIRMPFRPIFRMGKWPLLIERFWFYRLPTESLFYRAVLQDIIKDCYGITKCNQHVGKIYSKCSSFLDYVRKSLKKLGLDESKLKVVLAPCIETLILLDRLCYLKEQEDIAWSALVKLFDPVKSPRCYAVIALKKQQ